MKYLLTALLFIAYCNLAAQEKTNFEGRITYVFQNKSENKPRYAEAIVSDSKFKFSSYRLENQKKVYESGYKLLDFSKNLAYSINENKCALDSMHLVDDCPTYILKPTDETELIVGHTARKYSILNEENINAPEAKNGLYFWYSDELAFSTQPSRPNNRIMFSANDNVLWLKFLLIIEWSSGTVGYEEKTLDTAMITAIKIEPGPIDKSEFVIPSGLQCPYEKNSANFFRIQSVTQVEVEEEPSPPPPPPPPPPHVPKQKNQKNTKSKLD